MIIYHGFLRGLQSLAIQVNKPITASNDKQEVYLKPSSLDTNLIRLVANMVLSSQAEVMHVY